MTSLVNLAAEWLETDGLGGFASGTVSTRRTRRYHAWLLTAATPPIRRFVLVNGGDIWIETESQREFLSVQEYAPDVIAPDAPPVLESFVTEPWPTWNFRLKNGTAIRQELLAVHDQPTTILRWTVTDRIDDQPVRLVVRPFFSGRNYHALHHENPGFRFAPELAGHAVNWSVYPGVPPVCIVSNGVYLHEPYWYRNFLYATEQSRGLDCIEDLAAPGTFRWTLRDQPALMMLSADQASPSIPDPQPSIETLIAAERTRRSQFVTVQSPRPRPGGEGQGEGASAPNESRSPHPNPLPFKGRGDQTESVCQPLLCAADAYVVRRGTGRTLIAGYPWFTDWGRDTFISLRGLCLATRRFQLAEEILVGWSGLVSEGMLPNRFPDAGEAPEFNAVDASLWYAIAVAEFLQRGPKAGYPISTTVRGQLEAAVDRILRGYANGTRFNIRMDHDGLIAAGEPGLQLTWMDAKVGNLVITPRIGKPIEIQALWLNALAAFRYLSSDYESWFRQGRQAFGRRFWNPARHCLYDVIDADHQADRQDDSIRPNQIFAVGGLPLVLLPPEEARSVVDQVQRDLLTPWGLRTLSPGDPHYQGRYAGGVSERDGAYHQGTAWPWLLGPFVEAWLRVHGETPENRRLARERFLAPLEDHLHTFGLGHLAEVADGDPPHKPGGCPFQAWSLGEFLRLKLEVLAE